MGYNGFPSGKIHFGDTLADAARRELHDKAGLEGVELTQRGFVVMRFLHADEVVNHIVTTVFYIKTGASCQVDHDTKYFRTFWGSEQELTTPPYFKGNREILELLRAHPNFFYQEYDFLSDY